MNDEVLLELRFYRKLKGRRSRKIFWVNPFLFIVLPIGYFIFIPHIARKFTSTSPQWYSYVPLVLFLTLYIIFKVSKALIEKQNYLKITSDTIQILNNRHIAYKEFDLKSIYWIDFTIKKTEDHTTKQLYIATNNKDEYFDLNQFQDKQIEILISKLKELDLDVRYYNC